MSPASTATAPSPRAVWGYVAFTAVTLGSGGLVAKALVDDGWDPFTLSWLPFMIGGIAALGVGLASGHLRRDALRDGAMLGIAVGTIPAILFNNGFDRLPAGLVTLLISLAPVVTAIVAHFVFADERFNRIKALGLVLAVCGVGVLATGSINDSEGDGFAIGLVVMGAIVAGAASVLSRVVASRHGALAIIAPQLLASALGGLLVAVALGRPLGPEGGLETWHVLTIIPFGLSGFFGFFTMLKANEIGTTGQVSVIVYCVPVFGVLGGALLFGDAITTAVILGGSLIFTSMWIIARGSGGRTPQHPHDQGPSIH